MPNNSSRGQLHSIRYSACEHCGGIIRHETWCIARDPVVYYAYQIVADPTMLTIGDALILHSLGVRWEANECAGKRKSKLPSAPTVSNPTL
jgi:hypothetical protein